jgi:ABC-2 type transport system ATP-binding protein
MIESLSTKLQNITSKMRGKARVTEADIKEMMREHAARGNSVLFSTHVLETADKLCDAVCIIAHGHKLFDGTLEALKAAHPGISLEQIFLEMTANE